MGTLGWAKTTISPFGGCLIYSPSLITIVFFLRSFLSFGYSSGAGRFGLPFTTTPLWPVARECCWTHVSDTLPLYSILFLVCFLFWCCSRGNDLFFLFSVGLPIVFLQYASEYSSGLIGFHSLLSRCHSRLGKGRKTCTICCAASCRIMIMNDPSCRPCH